MTQAEEILNAVGELDDELLTELYAPEKPKRTAVKRALALAACAAIIAAAGVMLHVPERVPSEDIVDPPHVTQAPTPSTSVPPEPSPSPQTTPTPTSDATPTPPPSPTPMQPVNTLVYDHIPHASQREAMGFQPHPADDDDDDEGDDDDDDFAFDRESREFFASHGFDLPDTLFADYRSVRHTGPFARSLHDPLREYADSGTGSIIIRAAERGECACLPVGELTANEFRGVKLYAVEDAGVHEAEFLKNGLDVFVWANKLTDAEFEKLLEMLL